MDTPSDPPRPEAPPRAGHETTDADVGYVAVAAIGVLIVAAVGLAASYGLWRGFERATARDEAPANSLTGSQLPPEPRLQAVPSLALDALRRHEEEQLTSYKWIDRDREVVRIPVDRAVALLAERGFPAPQPTATAAPIGEPRREP